MRGLPSCRLPLDVLRQSGAMLLLGSVITVASAPVLRADAPVQTSPTTQPSARDHAPNSLGDPRMTQPPGTESTRGADAKAAEGGHGPESNPAVERTHSPGDPVPGTQPATTQSASAGSKAQPVFTVKPFPQDVYGILLNRSMFTRDGNAAPGGPGGGPPEANLALRGVMAGDAQFTAFIEDVAGHRTQLLRTGDVIGSGRVERIELGSLSYQSGGKVTRVEVGQNLMGMPAPPPLPPSTGPAQPPGAPVAAPAPPNPEPQQPMITSGRPWQARPPGAGRKGRG